MTRCRLPKSAASDHQEISGLGIETSVPQTKRDAHALGFIDLGIRSGSRDHGTDQEEGLVIG